LDKDTTSGVLSTFQISNLRVQINCKTRINTMATSTAAKVNRSKTPGKVRQPNSIEELANSNLHQVDTITITRLQSLICLSHLPSQDQTPALHSLAQQPHPTSPAKSATELSAMLPSSPVATTSLASPVPRDVSAALSAVSLSRTLSSSTSNDFEQIDKNK
jgi:hypothetical protein